MCDGILFIINDTWIVTFTQWAKHLLYWCGNLYCDTQIQHKICMQRCMSSANVPVGRWEMEPKKLQSLQIRQPGALKERGEKRHPVSNNVEGYQWHLMLPYTFHSHLCVCVCIAQPETKTGKEKCRNENLWSLRTQVIFFS